MCELCRARTGRERLCGLVEFAWLVCLILGNVGFWVFASVLLWNWLS